MATKITGPEDSRVSCYVGKKYNRLTARRFIEMRGGDIGECWVRYSGQRNVEQYGVQTWQNTWNSVHPILNTNTLHAATKFQPIAILVTGDANTAEGNLHSGITPATQPVIGLSICAFMSRLQRIPKLHGGSYLRESIQRFGMVTP